MEEKKEEEKKPTLKEEVVDFFKFAFIFGILFFSFRSFVYDYFIIPSSSMFPTLLIGDMPLVEKWTYGYSKHSFWFSPDLFNGRKFKKREIVRGEVVVFKAPEDTEINVIKRVFGLPGDRIKVINGDVYINDEKANRVFKKDVIYVDERDFTHRPLKIYEETIPFSNIKHEVAYDEDRKLLPQNNMAEFTVPNGCYFVIGDNRDYSKDSRCGLGLVPEVNLMGRAIKVIHSIGNCVKLWEPHLWMQNIRYDRIFKKII